VLVDSICSRWGEKADDYSAVCLETGEVEHMELIGQPAHFLGTRSPTCGFWRRMADAVGTPPAGRVAGRPTAR